MPSGIFRGCVLQFRLAWILILHGSTGFFGDHRFSVARGFSETDGISEMASEICQVQIILAAFDANGDGHLNFEAAWLHLNPGMGSMQH